MYFSQFHGNMQMSFQNRTKVKKAVKASKAAAEGQSRGPKVCLQFRFQQGRHPQTLVEIDNEEDKRTEDDQCLGLGCTLEFSFFQSK